MEKIIRGKDSLKAGDNELVEKSAEAAADSEGSLLVKLEGGAISFVNENGVTSE